VVEVTRKEKESPEALYRRFKRKVQQSGVLLQARKGRFFLPKKSKKIQKEEAIRKEDERQKREFLKKIGKIQDKKHW